MSAEVLQFPDLAAPVVYVLSGRSGIGKTRLLSHYAGANPLTFDYFRPRFQGEVFAARIDFTRFPVVAIDNLLEWEQRTLPRVIGDLERKAMRFGGKLILVLRDPKELLRCGYSLVRGPTHICLTSARFAPEDLRRLPRAPAPRAQKSGGAPC